MSEPPQIRAAGPEDVPLVAEVLEMAARGHLPRGPWDLAFPDPAERRSALRSLADGAPSWCHHRHFHVARAAGADEAGAALCSFEPASIGGSDLGPALGPVFQALGVPPERLAEIGSAMGTYLGCFPDLPEGTWIVEQVGTRPGWRRRGLVAALLVHALEEGRRRGFAQAQISCLVGNAPARRAYEQAGFRVVEERKSPEFEALLGAPGFWRMGRSL